MKKILVVRHYVNLIGWQSILKIMREVSFRSNERHIFYCDTWSLRLLARVYGYKVRHKPGPSQIPVIRALKSVQFLTAHENGGGVLVLPMFANDQEIIEFLRKFQPQSENIVIGISSPKQNYFALNLCKNNHLYKLPIKNIWCLGAALYGNFSDTKYFYLINFLITNPGRTLNKMTQTFLEILNIFLGNDRSDFEEFVSKLEFFS